MIDPVQSKRTRQVIVELIYDRHSKQQSRADDSMMWRMVNDLGCDVSENDLLMALQDLFDRGYLVYREDKDRKTHAVKISEIQLTPRGRDLVERTVADPAIPF